nr:MAG TPA: hypothetical protein [Caudoviricetes sp.]
MKAERPYRGGQVASCLRAKAALAPTDNTIIVWQGASGRTSGK